MKPLADLTSLIKDRNKIDDEISAIIGYPAEKGHVGEFIAAKIFNITQNKSATHKAHDGAFSDGTLKNKTVNVKFYSKREGLLDLQPRFPPDYYLVLTGPKSTPTSSRGKTRPWTINSVFLFDAKILHETLKNRGLKLGIATSVKENLWNSSEIYPTNTNNILILNEYQKECLKLFNLTK
ncbi:MAG: hypothetical protein QXW37_08610 [Candidatus Nitrosotenuis sp.]